IRVGGYELDEAIVRHLQQQEKLLIGQEQAEAVKVELAAAVPDAAVPPTASVAGRDLATGLLRRAEVSAAEIAAAIEPPLRRIVDAVVNVLEQTPPALVSDIADRGITVVGGGALLRGFDELLRSATGLPVTVADEPLLTVARGAGNALEEIDAFRKATRDTPRPTVSLRSRS